jgi:MUN domain
MQTLDNVLIALRSIPFPFKIEDLLQRFVWDWIASVQGRIDAMVDEAIKQDNFRVRTEEFPDQIPTDNERHSVSVIDIFRLFNSTVDRIVSFEWDDDLQYAKFMTALSKSIGAGIARYCENVEKMFTKEMDRQTPEQEAAARATRQEKWMQIAKDVWSNKVKIEPFQFFPEVSNRTIEYSENSNRRCSPLSSLTTLSSQFFNSTNFKVMLMSTLAQR